MKTQHVHDFRLISSHPFVAVRKYQCSSCPEIREERRESEIERMNRLGAELGIPVSTQEGTK